MLEVRQKAGIYPQFHGFVIILAEKASK